MRRRLIVNADDYGLCAGVDLGIREAAASGVVTSVSVLAGRATRDGIRALLDAAPGVGIGLHVDLTSDLVHPHGRDPAPCVRDQYARFVGVVGRPPDHVDTHKHLHRDDPAALEAIALCGAPVRSCSAAQRETLRRRGIACTDHFVGDVSPAPYWTRARLLRTLRSLGPGTTELMCHPGHPHGIPAALRYRLQRTVELRTFTAPDLRRRMESLAIELVGFGALSAKDAGACG